MVDNALDGTMAALRAHDNNASESLCSSDADITLTSPEPRCKDELVTMKKQEDVHEGEEEEVSSKFQPKTVKEGTQAQPPETDRKDLNQVVSFRERTRVNSMPSPSKSRERIVWNKINSLQLGLPWSPGKNRWTTAKDLFLHKTLHRHSRYPFTGNGPLTLEVNYDDIVGVMYENPLVLDTTLTLESRKITIRRFESEMSLQRYYDSLLGNCMPKSTDDYLKSKMPSKTSNLHRSSLTPSPPKGYSKPSQSSSIIHSRTLMVSFSDPIMPAVLRVAFLKDRRILTMCESGLPSWAVFLGTCGMYYRPWMRKLADLCFIAVGILSLFIGFYDLYKNIPWARDFMIRLSKPVVEWVEDNPFWRLSILFTYLFAKSPVLYNVVNQLRRLGLGLVSLWNLFSRTLSGLLMVPIPGVQIVVTVWSYSMKFISTTMHPIIWILSIAFKICKNIFGPLFSGSPVAVLIVKPALLVSRTTFSIVSAIWNIFSNPNMAAVASSTNFALLAQLNNLWSTILSKIIYVLRAMLLLLLFIADKLTRHRYSLSLSISKRLEKLTKASHTDGDSPSGETNFISPTPHGGLRRRHVAQTDSKEDTYSK